MKNKLISLCLALLVITLLAFQLNLTADAAVIESGTCGENLTWTFEDGGVLTISGEGAMDDYYSVPWYNYRNKITSVSIGGGVTSIGENAFENCDNLVKVVIPGNVTMIGENAFSYCDALTSVTIPNSVTSIDAYAFAGCPK